MRRSRVRGRGRPARPEPLTRRGQPPRAPAGPRGARGVADLGWSGQEMAEVVVGEDAPFAVPGAVAVTMCHLDDEVEMVAQNRVMGQLEPRDLRPRRRPSRISRNVARERRLRTLSRTRITTCTGVRPSSCGRASCDTSATRPLGLRLAPFRRPPQAGSCIANCFILIRDYNRPSTIAPEGSRPRERGADSGTWVRDQPRGTGVRFRGVFADVPVAEEMHLRPCFGIHSVKATSSRLSHGVDSLVRCRPDEADVMARRTTAWRCRSA